MNYKITISYDGSRYQGWQGQKNTNNTIQEKIESSLAILLEEPIKINGAGRTDAGVHALGQVANFHTKQLLSEEVFLYKINKILPEDIGVMNLETVPEQFHARLNAKGKIYSYTLYLKSDSPVLNRKYVFHHPDPLDLERMKNVSKILLGTHDFSLFNDNKRIKKSTIRTIESIHFEEKNGYLTLNFYGDGFMYHMIRRMVGMLIHIAENYDISIPTNIFTLSERPATWPLAPARGLTLQKIIYE